MSIDRRQLLINAFRLFDLMLMVLAFGLATLAVLHEHGGMSLTRFLSLRVTIQNFALFFGLLVTWHLIFMVLGLYGSKRLSTRAAVVTDVTKATTLATLCVALAAIVFRINLADPLFLGVFWTASTATTISTRLVIRHLLARIRSMNRNLRSMLIVGTNPRAVEFARKIESKPEFGYRILGFVDDGWPGLEEFRKMHYPLLCGLADFPNFVRDGVVDEVVMALPIRSSYFQASRIAALCEEQGIIVRLFTNLFDLKMARSKVEEFDDGSIITLSTGTWEEWQLMVKRIVDFMGSLVLIILLSPWFLVVAILIKLTSRGPVFFIQKRVGLNKRRFSMHKFRTMVQNAEQLLREVEHLNEAQGPVFKIKNDPRLTRIGTFLRKTSIDELPQLFNVLKGEMSLVGPRPLPVRDYEGMDQDWQRRRFSMPPGITCLWQINGRSSLPFEKWMELDMQYLNSWSLWLDLKILLRTIPAVLKGTGAA